jgi:hypothetical protein
LWIKIEFPNKFAGAVAAVAISKAWHVTKPQAILDPANKLRIVSDKCTRVSTIRQYAITGMDFNRLSE